MSRQGKGARLWLRPARVDKGKERPAVWIIRDGNHQQSTGCGAGDYAGAETRLAEYIAQKYRPNRIDSRHPSAIPVADVLRIYVEDRAQTHARPKETIGRVEALMAFWGDKPLSAVNGSACRAYVSSRSTPAAARRELEDLRSAINHHRREGLCSEIIEVILPEKSRPRERWLARGEAARLLRAAWRKSPHVARFILVGLYTGTRAGAICGASLSQVSGRGYIDTDRGIFYRRAEGAKITKKRQPPIPLPPRLLAHIRRWRNLGLCKKAVVEWNGAPVKRVSKAFAIAARDAGLAGVSPHTLRHTAATWMMENGAETADVAKFLGMTEAMVEDRYGHIGPKSHSRAIAAISRR